MKTLSGDQRQSVAIARAVYFNAETAQVRELVSELNAQGIGIFLKLPEEVSQKELAALTG